MTTPRTGIVLRDLSKRAGLTGVTISGEAVKEAVIEVNGGGACWLDYNNDGWVDLFVVNGSTLQHFKQDRRPAKRYPHYLYKNNTDATFSEVAEDVGVSLNSWGTGCVSADYDNDGNTDLFVSNIGESFLYRNRGDGTFEEVAAKAGVGGGFNWHTGAAFGDYDGDGWLDLYVAAYLDPSQMLQPQGQCNLKGLPIFCGPAGLKGAPDALYRNNGDGTFSEVTEAAGATDQSLLFGLGVSFEDFDDDGRPDIFVANDVGRNYLYHNLGNGKFEEIGEISGLAYPLEGKAQADMGVAIGDYNRDGRMDLFVTTFSDERYTLYHNLGGIFIDRSIEAGLAAATTSLLGWGTFFSDLNNDGRLELFMANGHIYPQVDQLGELAAGYDQPALLFWETADGTFVEIGRQSGLENVRPHSSRAAAYADFDNDGKIDLVYTNIGAAPTLLRNETPSDNHFIQIKLQGVKSNRDGIGARLKLTAGDLVLHASRRAGESYLSSHDARIHFGLGQAQLVDELEIRWPSGQIDYLRNLPADRVITVQEGVPAK